MHHLQDIAKLSPANHMTVRCHRDSSGVTHFSNRNSFLLKCSRRKVLTNDESGNDDGEGDRSGDRTNIKIIVNRRMTIARAKQLRVRRHVHQTDNIAINIYTIIM